MILSFLLPTQRTRVRGTPLYFELVVDLKTSCVSTSAYGRLIKVPIFPNGCVRAAFFNCPYEHEDDWLVQLIQGDLATQVRTARSFAEAATYLTAPTRAIYSDQDLLAQVGSELSLDEAVKLTKMQGYLVKVSEELKAYVLPGLPPGWGLLAEESALLGVRQSYENSTAIAFTDPHKHLVVVRPT